MPARCGGDIVHRVMSVPIGSWLLWTAALLLFGGFLRTQPAEHRLYVPLLGLVLGLHLAAGYWPVLLWPAVGALVLTAMRLAGRRLSSLTLAAAVATAAVMLLAWPAAVASGVDAVTAAGIGVGVMAAVTATGKAAPLAALIGVLAGHLTLGHSFDGSATFTPDTEQFFQVAATAAAAAAAFSLLISRAWSLRGRLAR